LKAETKEQQLTNFPRRTTTFAAAVIKLHMKLGQSREEAAVYGKQMLHSGTSLAVHTVETSRVRSDADSFASLEVPLQEVDETMVRLLQEDCGIPTDFTQSSHAEANELISIMTTMTAPTDGTS